MVIFFSRSIFCYLQIFLKITFLSQYLESRKTFVSDFLSYLVVLSYLIYETVLNFWWLLQNMKKLFDFHKYGPKR